MIDNPASPLLAPMDVAGRIPRLQALFEEAGVDTLVVTCLTNVRYLTGFSGTAGMVLVCPDSATLLTDGRYRTQSAEQIAEVGVDVAIEIGRPPEQRKKLIELCAGHSRIGLEAEHVSWATQQSLAKTFAGEDEAGEDEAGGEAGKSGDDRKGERDELCDAKGSQRHPRHKVGQSRDFDAEQGECAEPEAAEQELVATVGLVGALRRVKDAGELARMQAAAAIADAALASVLHLLVSGVTEVELAAALDHQMRQLGASDRSFETIVASGPNSAMPHARPTTRQVREGELVVIDFGAVFDGYCSDMTRTYCIGEPSSQVLAAVVEVVTASQVAGVAAVAAGVEAVEVDRACRDVVSAAGWADAFMHGTGHGVGLDIHEAPSVGSRSTDKLEESCVVTVEPGVYLPDHGGARIEDTLVVTSDGCTVLTHAPKDLAPR